MSCPLGFKPINAGPAVRCVQRVDHIIFCPMPLYLYKFEVLRLPGDAARKMLLEGRQKDPLRSSVRY